MVKYYKNGVLETETLDLPQDCGSVKVVVNVEEEIENANYYLEFSCPRNVKYISEKLTRTGEGEYTITLPRGISEHIGEVYTQLVIMSSQEAILIGRSLIARNPIFVIKDSILASSALDSSERRDFFEYAQSVVANAQNRIDDMDNLIDNIPEKIADKVDEKMTEVDSLIEQMDKTVEENYESLNGDLELLESKVDGNKTELDNLISETSTRLEESIEQNTESINTNATQIESLENLANSNKSRIEEVENILPDKFDKADIVNEFNNSNNCVFSTLYMNSSYCKKIHRGQAVGPYVSSTSMTQAATFNPPANGYLVISFNSYFGATPTQQVAIQNTNKSREAATSYSGTDTWDKLDTVASITMCTYVARDTAVKLLAKCDTANKTNYYRYNYILFEMEE